MTASRPIRAMWMPASSSRATDPAGNPNFDIAPNGKRALLQARGDLFTLPAEHGNTRDLTQTSNAKEENPSWSPDGKWIAYVTDVSGEDQIAMRPSEGGAEQILSGLQDRLFLPAGVVGGQQQAGVLRQRAPALVSGHEDPQGGEGRTRTSSTRSTTTPGRRTADGWPAASSATTSCRASGCTAWTAARPRW